MSRSILRSVWFFLEPANPLYARRLVDAHTLVASFASHEGQHEVSAEHARQALAIAERLLAADPNVLEYRFAMANALGAMTRSRLTIGDVAKTADYARRWYELAEQLSIDTSYDADPHGPQRLIDAAETMAYIASRQAQGDDARRYMERALSAGAQVLTDHNPSPDLLSRYARLLSSVQQSDLRDRESALAAAERLEEIAGEWSDMLLTLGTIYCAVGDPDQGIDTLRRALSTLPPEDSPVRLTIEDAIEACSSKPNVLNP